MKKCMILLMAMALFIVPVTIFADETITLRLWGGVPAEAGPQASVDLFNEAFKDKGIQAEYERFVNDDTGNLKLETSLLAGNDVDLYMTYTPAILQKRASGNMALDLSELVARDGFDIEGTFGKMAISYYIDGKPYSLPTKMDQYGIVINQDMFEAAGIDIPTEWSFEEFRDIANKLTHGDGDNKVYGMFFNSQQDLLYPFNYFSVQTIGGDPLYNKDGTANVNDPINVAAIELVNNMMNVDHSAPTHTDSVTQKLSQEGMFITEKCAMTIGPWMVRSIKDRDNYPHDFKTAFAPYPTIDGVRKYTQGGYGDHLCINPKSKNIDAAWEFMKWYATEGMLPLTSGGRVPAANTYDSAEVTEYFLKGAEDLLDAETSKNVLIVPAENHAVPSITNKLPEINKVLTEELENIYTGVKTVQQGMDDAQARAEELLEK
ncbi:MAG: extracellular solute-binding protein [Christensenellales bacterium]|jgi:multiple sugar transport system substrate-binding protein